MHSVEGAVIEDVTNLEEDPLWLHRRLHGSKLQRGDGMDPVVVSTFQMLGGFKSVPHLYPITGLGPPPAT